MEIRSVINAKKAAEDKAKVIRSLLQGTHTNPSPGVWMLSEQSLNHIYEDCVTKQQFRVSDFV